MHARPRLRDCPQLSIGSRCLASRILTMRKTEAHPYRWRDVRRRFRIVTSCIRLLPDLLRSPLTRESGTLGRHVVFRSDRRCNHFADRHRCSYLAINPPLSRGYQLGVLHHGPHQRDKALGRAMPSYLVCALTQASSP